MEQGRACLDFRPDVLVILDLMYWWKGCFG